MLGAGASPLAADEFRSPAISVARVDWRAALDELRAEIGTRPSVVPAFTFVSRYRLPASDPRSMPALVQLNATTSQIFTGISRSPVPVLLPFDTAAYLEARWRDASEGRLLARFQADFRAADLFDAGPAGYDAVFSLEPGDGLPSRIFAKPVEVQITGSLLTYDLNDPLGGKGEPVKSLAAQFPDLRRFIREGYVRYAFTRFGIPYVVSIQCLDSVAKPKRLACREAYPVAERFLKTLRVAGGLPSRPRMDIAPETFERPSLASLNFTYRPPGDIIARSGSHKQIGRVDFTAYSQIRFPLEKAPAFAHSQSLGLRKSDRLDEPASGPTSYPWQDNFCEARSFGVGQCASGFGHQGQDMRPAPCPAHDEGPEHCDPKQRPVVAVRDAVLIRAPQQQAATLQVNTRNEHIRFRYMHMDPSVMDTDGVLSGRHVEEGERIGVVSNYLDRPNGTTRHLHFDVQVFTRDGWLWVNPYVTLVSAYERLIGGRGRELGPHSLPVAADLAHALPDEMNRRDLEEGSEN